MGVHAFTWEIYNNGVPLGLIGPDFRHTDPWFVLRQALAAPNAAVVVQDPALTNIPGPLQPGQTVPVSLTFQNTGPTWYKSVGYEVELIGPDGGNLGDRVTLQNDVASAGQTTFRFDFTAPGQAGSYHFQMAQHGIELFGEIVPFQVGA